MNISELDLKPDYQEETITFDQLADLQGEIIVEFGTSWCGHCQAAHDPIKAALKLHPKLPHLKITDGRGKPLGRAFKVKLWPTLIYLRDGKEVARLVRPLQTDQVRQFIEKA